MKKQQPQPCNADYPCPCCGYMSFDEPPGSYNICPICGWEDNPVQLKYPYSGGANHPLILAQRNFAATCAKANQAQPYMRPVMEGDVRDPDWRPFDPEIDVAPREQLSGIDYFNAVGDVDKEEPYYYWRKPPKEKES